MLADSDWAYCSLHRTIDVSVYPSPVRRNDTGPPRVFPRELSTAEPDQRRLVARQSNVKDHQSRTNIMQPGLAWCRQSHQQKDIVRIIGVHTNSHVLLASVSMLGNLGEIRPGRFKLKRRHQATSGPRGAVGGGGAVGGRGQNQRSSVRSCHRWNIVNENPQSPIIGFKAWGE